MRVFKTRALQASQPVSGRDVATKSLIVIPILAVSLWLFAGQTKGLDPAHVFEAVRNIPALALLASVFFTALSLWAVSAYDSQAFRVMALPPAKTTLRSGFTATAISQTLGFGLVIGTLARWRCYKAQGITVTQAAALTGIISAGFIGCLAIMLGLITLISPTAIPGVTISPFLIIGATLAIITLSALQLTIPLGKRRISLPTLPILNRFMSLTVADTTTAALALWILLPAESRPEFALFMQIFLVSLGLGLISSAPGGVGVFEVTCLMFLPNVPQAELISAILVFRGIYYGLPFLLGAALLLEVERTRSAKATAIPEPTDTTRTPDHIIAQSTQAEAALAYLGDKEFLVSDQQDTALMYGRSGSSLIALGTALGTQSGLRELLNQFSAKADSEGRTASIWRAGESLKSAAKSQGWTARLQGEEAILDPQTYSPTGKRFRELKRKLKQAETAGVIITHSKPGKANLTALEPIAAEWKTRHNNCELGFSQGRFDRKFLARHDILTAELNGTPIAFISLWSTPDANELSLDLMRSTDDLPQGTMHLLLHEAITLAKAKDATRFSLCAVQTKGLENDKTILGRFAHWIYTKQSKRHHLQGLARFKNAFRPDWEPRYLLTPSKLPPILTLWNIHRLLRK